MDIFSRGKKAANEKEQQKEFYFHSVLRAHGLGHAFQGVLRRVLQKFWVSAHREPPNPPAMPIAMAFHIPLSVCITFVCSRLSFSR